MRLRLRRHKHGLGPETATVARSNRQAALCEQRLPLSRPQRRRSRGEKELPSAGDGRRRQRGYESCGFGARGDGLVQRDHCASLGSAFGHSGRKKVLEIMSEEKMILLLIGLFVIFLWLSGWMCRNFITLF